MILSNRMLLLNRATEGALRWKAWRRSRARNAHLARALRAFRSDLQAPAHMAAQQQGLHRGGGALSLAAQRRNGSAGLHTPVPRSQTE